MMVHSVFRGRFPSVSDHVGSERGSRDGQDGKYGNHTSSSEIYGHELSPRVDQRRKTRCARELFPVPNGIFTG